MTFNDFYGNNIDLTKNWEIIEESNYLKLGDNNSLEFESSDNLRILFNGENYKCDEWNGYMWVTKAINKK